MSFDALWSRSVWELHKMHACSSRTYILQCTKCISNRITAQLAFRYLWIVFISIRWNQTFMKSMYDSWTSYGVTVVSINQSCVNRRSIDTTFTQPMCFKLRSIWIRLHFISKALSMKRSTQIWWSFSDSLNDGYWVHPEIILPKVIVVKYHGLTAYLSSGMKFDD